MPRRPRHVYSSRTVNDRLPAVGGGAALRYSTPGSGFVDPLFLGKMRGIAALLLDRLGERG
jgi:hypothetical protein